MTWVVVDASITLAWCFPDETSRYADGVLVALAGKTMLVPSIWSFEIANAILAGGRRERLNQAEIRQFMGLLEGLSITQDTRSVIKAIDEILPLARSHGLSAYDAAYLELAIRYGAPLATLDDKLRNAAQQEGVALFDR